MPLIVNIPVTPCRRHFYIPLYECRHVTARTLLAVHTNNVGKPDGEEATEFLDST